MSPRPWKIVLLFAFIAAVTRLWHREFVRLFLTRNEAPGHGGNLSVRHNHSTPKSLGLRAEIHGG